MAYLDLAADLPRAALVRREVRIEPILSTREIGIIKLSLRDGAATLGAPSRLRRLGRRLFGIASANPLADPKLEALRRFGVATRLGLVARREQLGEELRQLGYSPRQLEQAETIVVRSRAYQRRHETEARIRACVVPAVLVLLLTALAYWRTLAVIGSGFAATMLSLLMFVTILPFAMRAGRTV